MEFFLNVFTEFSKFSDKKFVIIVKGLEPATQPTSCVRDQHATTAPAGHMWETRSLNQAQFMLHWLSVSLNSLNSVKVLFHLGKTPISFYQLFSLSYLRFRKLCQYIARVTKFEKTKQSSRNVRQIKINQIGTSWKVMIANAVNAVLVKCCKETLTVVITYTCHVGNWIIFAKIFYPSSDRRNTTQG